MENFENEVMEETVETMEEVIDDGFVEVTDAEIEDSEVSVETSDENESVGAGLVVGLVAGAGLAVYGGVKLVKDVVIPGGKRIAEGVSSKLEEKKAAKEAKKKAKLAKKEDIEAIPEVVDEAVEVVTSEEE